MQPTSTLTLYKVPSVPAPIISLDPIQARLESLSTLSSVFDADLEQKISEVESARNISQNLVQIVFSFFVYREL